jgi:hypothetical protein
MAAPTEKKVVVGAPAVGGAIFRAPLGTALPTSETAALNAAFVSQGHVSTDGFTRTIEKAYAAQMAWGGQEVGKNRTELAVSAGFALLQTIDADVLETVFGEDAVTVTAATVSAGEKIAIAYAGEELPESAWVIDMAYKGRKRRIVFPNAQMTTESVEQTFTDEDMAPFPVELTIYPDSSGKYFYEYTDDGVFAPA